MQNSAPNSFVDDDYKSNVAQYSLQLWKQNWRFVRTKMVVIQKISNPSMEIKEKRRVYNTLFQESKPLSKPILPKQHLKWWLLWGQRSQIDMDLKYTVEGARWTQCMMSITTRKQMRLSESFAMVVQNSGENGRM